MHLMSSKFDRLTPKLAALVGVILVVSTPSAASAYMGPGLGMGAVGVTLGVLGSILLGLMSIVWYPAKRMIRAVRRRSSGRTDRSASRDMPRKTDRPWR